jgi:hypothetical protein
MEEFDAKRRLVQFTRHQKQSTIYADFTAIAPEDRSPNSITISCIWWEEKKECFVTSVDTIYLLESLVAVRFTVEEKNRIRRNLEGFRPLTVSKSKAESEEFFKTIMGFPNPKPRNIEKDVKVFPWKILSQALKKIISKYSASYSSTASAILTPTSSGYASTDASAEHIGSPANLDVSTTSAGSYAIMTPATCSPEDLQAPASAPTTVAVTPVLRVQLPSIDSGYNLPPNYSYPSMSMAQSISTPHAMSAPPSRLPSWDFASFVNPGPATASADHHGSVHGGPLSYSRATSDVGFLPPTAF